MEAAAPNTRARTVTDADVAPVVSDRVAGPVREEPIGPKAPEDRGRDALPMVPATEAKGLAA